MSRRPDVFLPRLALDVRNDATPVSQAKVSQSEKRVWALAWIHPVHSLRRGALAIILGPLNGLPAGSVGDVADGIVVLKLVGTDLDGTRQLHVDCLSIANDLEPVVCPFGRRDQDMGKVHLARYGVGVTTQ